MILRKPYAFFIKHFKLIHIILAVLSCYLIFRTKLILDFFNDYAANIMNVIGQDLTGTLMYGYIYILPILIILITITILVVMIVKKKPYLFYIINIISFIYVIVIFQVIRSTLLTMEISLIDVRTARLVRDLITVGFITQIISTIIIIIRATGFDVKKFGFKEDLQDLHIEDEDREEFELQLNVDHNKTKRKIRYLIRSAKYAYLENKLISNIAIVVVFLLTTYGIVMLIINKETVINQNNYFYGNNLTLSLIDSYITDTDYSGKVIDKESNFVILKIKVKNNTIKSSGLDVATTKLLVGNYIYTPTTKYKDSFVEFGNIYQDENISREFEIKTLIYQIPKQLFGRDMIFSFVDKTNIQKDGLFSRTKVNISYKDLIKEGTTKEYKLGDTINFENSIIEGYNLNIKSFDIQKNYKLSYNFCPITNNCTTSYEYLNPTTTSSYDKVLLKLEATISKEENDNLVKNIYDPYDLISYFATINYVINGENKYQTIALKEVTPKMAKNKDIYYIEILSEIMNAEKVSINFKVKNENYAYVLK